MGPQAAMMPTSTSTRFLIDRPVIMTVPGITLVFRRTEQGIREEILTDSIISVEPQARHRDCWPCGIPFGELGRVWVAGKATSWIG